MWCGSNAQQLFSFSHSGVIDCLDVDVVTRHHDVTDLSVLLYICNLQKSYTFKSKVVDGLCGGSRSISSIEKVSSVGVKSKVNDWESSHLDKLFSFYTWTGMMWLGQWTTGRPESTSICRSSLTLLWCFLLSTWPSSLFRMLMDSFAPASSMGGREVVKMKPAASERTVSTRALVLAM